jgi:hypothetical protein
MAATTQARALLWLPGSPRHSQPAARQASRPVVATRSTQAGTVTQVDLGKGTYDHNAKQAEALPYMDTLVNFIKKKLESPDAEGDCGPGRIRVVEVGGQE